MTVRRVLLDEHVDRVLEHVLFEAGYEVFQARDQFGEGAGDAELLRWSAERDAVVLTNNAKDFEALHDELEHSGILLYYEQGLPDFDPEGFARAIEAVFHQYEPSGIANELVVLDEWYDWIHGRD